MKKLRLVALATIAAGAVAAVATAASVKTGPSSSQSPYVVPVDAAPGIQARSILTVGDSPAGSSYRMVGIPDGLGTFSNGDGMFTVLMNHRLTPTSGVARAHGGTGAFVSRWIVDRNLEVESGADLIQKVFLWQNGACVQTAGVQFNRFCSADLADATAFSDGSLGYDGRIYLNGEESGAEGRGFARVATGPDAGTTYELPAVGNMSFENSLAHPGTGAKTVVALTDDSGDGQVYVHVGQKQASGNPVQRAGLTGGTLFGVKLSGLTQETDATSITETSFTAASLGDVSSRAGAQLETASDTAGVTGSTARRTVPGIRATRTTSTS